MGHHRYYYDRRRRHGCSVTTPKLQPGSVLWINMDPTIGREQAGQRPGVVVASSGYLDAVPELVIIVPVTTTDRSWPHHVILTGPTLGLPQRSYAMTEQPRTISRQRIINTAGEIDHTCMADIRRWINDFLGH